MGTKAHVTNPQARLAPLTQQDRLQIVLALHTPVERDAQASNYQELSEEALIQQADALLPAIHARTIFLDEEVMNKEGFAQAVRERYTILYRGMVVAHQLVDDLSEESAPENEPRRFQDDFLEHLRGDYHEEPLVTRKVWLSLLLNITENLTHSPSASGSDLFDALEEAILDYQRRYPRMAAAMQCYLQSWLHANSEH